MPRATCRLSALEAAVLGHLRTDDVPGCEIPARYFHYVRTGDARPLDPVLEHNRLDLLALAMLTSAAARLLERGSVAARTAREALGLAWLFDRGGLANEAQTCLARALDLPGDAATRAEALWTYGVACRRAGRFDQAAAAWRRLLTMAACPERTSRDAAEALAVHHEHRLRDFEQARDLAMASLRLSTSAVRRAGAERRVARLDRRIAEVRTSLVPLFS
jgi:tetratricopeptide (TPR) repeat protein